MHISPKSIRFDDDTLWVSLSDGRTIAAPLAWFPRLLNATPEQRAKVELSKSGLHWEALDEDISVAGWEIGVRLQLIFCFQNFAWSMICFTKIVQLKTNV